MESNLNIIYLFLGIAVIVFSAIGGLFYKIYAFGREKAEEQNKYDDIIEGFKTLKNEIEHLIQIETSKIQNDWDKWQIRQEANNISQEKEILALKESQRAIEGKFESALNKIYTEINSLNQTLTKVITIQDQSMKSTRGVTRGK